MDRWSHLGRICHYVVGLEGVRFHDLLHTHARSMPRRGVHPKIVREGPGHEWVRNTLDAYPPVTPSLQAAAPSDPMKG